MLEIVPAVASHTTHTGRATVAAMAVAVVWALIVLGVVFSLNKKRQAGQIGAVEHQRTMRRLSLFSPLAFAAMIVTYFLVK